MRPDAGQFSAMPVKVKTDGSTAIMAKVARRLRLIRELAGLNQDEVCRMLGGVEQTTYSKWERGIRTPDVLVMRLFAARFRTSLDFIFSGKPGRTHPELLRLIRLADADLVEEEPNDTPPDKDKDLAAYRAAIALEVDG